MIKIGMMIGDRYEVLEKIGTGGMSDVYKAKCHKLNRFVSIKVLKQEFSENANFVSKFRTEAQAAAGLMHPNIVNVYDVGEENGIHYIVMELVEGITLKKYIEKKARLSFKEAVSIAIQVSMGIQAAHNNHIIHRDIKPQNIMISKDGKVKVTDFGIAKAATSNTITSNVMGSVHYTSPEQARGGYSDEKSDIYSLGITMFEMLTGRVPFNGETTVAIAIKHIQEELPSPKEFVPEIPGSVESIVIKCCQKSPDRRYQNMQDLVADLKQSLMSPDADFVVKNDPDMEGGTRMITDSDMRKIKRRTNGGEKAMGKAATRRRPTGRRQDTLRKPTRKAATLRTAIRRNPMPRQAMGRRFRRSPTLRRVIRKKPTLRRYIRNRNLIRSRSLTRSRKYIQSRNHTRNRNLIRKSPIQRNLIRRSPIRRSLIRNRSRGTCPGIPLRRTRAGKKRGRSTTTTQIWTSLPRCSLW
jgi:serine/threonine protein kinase